MTEAAKKLILVVIDGLTPAVFERAIEDGSAPTLAFLSANGTYRRGVSTFPSLTPVCLSSIATGAHPDVHHIPHLVWYHRSEARLVEYGSSFAAVRAAGMAQAIRDATLNMNAEHLAPGAVTIFEALEDAGLTTAAINFTCYRGRHRHPPTLPGLRRAAYGPKRFFCYNLFESDVTGAPIGVLGRATGSLDAYAAAVGRWLVTRDGFDLLVFYLPDYDFASHASGPDDATAALARSDAAVSALVAAAGGPDEFLDRYAVVVCSDHGQTRVESSVRLEQPFSDLRIFGAGAAARAEIAVGASNRAGMIYRLDSCRLGVREFAERLDGADGVDVVLFLEGDDAVARRQREELRFSPAADGGWRTSGDRTLLEEPDALERSWAALANPNAGEILVSAARGFEFADLAGRDHRGGGSHGSLLAGDSEVPLLTVGLDGEASRIVEVAPLLLRHFGVEVPAYVRALRRAA